MKLNWGYIKLFLVLIGIGLLFGFAEKRHNARLLSGVAVQFTDNENLYVTEEVVNNMLIQNEAPVASIDKETLALNRLENLLNEHDMVENAEVYIDLGGMLRAKVSQRKPIGRVLGESSFYLDKNGEIMPLSAYYSARVPSLFGFNKNNAVEAFPLLDAIKKDSFFKKHVTGIKRLPNAMLELKLRSLSFKVYFGKPENIKLKLSNFKAFYKKALEEDKLDVYKKVNLQFGDQVVCTKR